MIRIEKSAATYICGNAREIKSLYHNLLHKTIYTPLYADEPKFNMQKCYGICIDFESFIFPTYYIISELDVCYLLMGEFEGGN